VGALFGLGFLNEYPWLRNSPSVFAILRGVGFLMTLAGGLWAAFDFSARRRYFSQKERHLGRILGFATMISTGFFLLAISLGNLTGVEVFFGLLLPRAIALFLWALALTSLRERTGTLDFLLLQGAGRKFPATAVLLMLAQFSVAGVPLLAGFPARVMLLQALAETNVVGAIGVILGSIGLLVAALRTMAILVMSPTQDDETLATTPETPGWTFVLVGGIIVLFLAGLFPQWFSSLIARLPLAFPALGL
jgi:formate hydrogenlyase subunit 3/multisubunit Na+/H+ antiporter MnhD subunit